MSARAGRLRGTPGRRRSGAARSRRWRAAVVGLLAGTAVVTGACGMPYASAPQPLSGPLPSQLVTPTSGPPVPVNPHDRVVANLYYVVSSVLTQFPTNIAKPATLSELLQRLESGPSISQAGSGVRTYLPQLGGPTGTVEGDDADIHLDYTFYGLQGTSRTFYLGQLVYSVLGTFRNLKAVTFDYNGQSVAVPVGPGDAKTARAVDERTYCAVSATGCPTTKGGAD